MKILNKKNNFSSSNIQANIENKDDKINRQNINKSYLLLYAIVLLVVIGFGVISHFVFGESVRDMLKDTVGNLVGILVAFLLFDIINEKLSKDSYSKEMSKNILEALMAKPETLDSFTQEQRNTFILSTVKSSVKDVDVAEMISNQCLEYLSKQNYDKIKLKFDYKFEIQSRLPSVFNCFSNVDDYYYVQEILGYTVRQIRDKPSYIFDKAIYIGFLFDNKSLDDVLRATTLDEDFNKCIFRENLDINKEDIDYLRGLPQDKFTELVNKIFKFDVQIDQEKGILQCADLKPNGILLKFNVDINNEVNEHNVRIIFHMPKLYGTILQVVFPDPTKAPNITVSYPEELIDIEMHSFLSKGKESSNEIAHEKANGIFDIALNSEWIYPISGLVFTVCKKEN